MINDIPLEEIHENLAELLEGTGLFRVLRKQKPPSPALLPEPPDVRTAIFVDTETTGLDQERDEIIELAMVPFCYDPDGRITSIGEAWEGLREPSAPIPPAAGAVHGITDAMVAGQTIDPDAVARFIAPYNLVVAHNATFDRGFLERFCAAFAGKAFACSMTEVDWKGEGHEGVKLSHLAADHGFFYDRHRAVHDCHAALEVLSRPLLKSGGSAMAALLEQARQPTWRIWATGAPYDLKHLLKVRGYHWHDGVQGRERSWYVDVSDAARAGELEWLEREIFRRPINLSQRRLDAVDRYSARALA